MQRKTKKGFTIVELVIVIAVIGVLTAILVPTFISLTAKANKASDQSLVANLNTALKMQEAEDGEKNPTMHDAVLDLEKQGYKLSQLISKSGQDLVWNIETNEFELVKNQSGVKYWKIYKNVPAENKQNYSIYAGHEWAADATSVSVKVGFDAGYNKNIATVNYTNSNEQKVVIRTNGGNLTINAASDKVYHYGKADALDIITVASSSYHENGTVGYAKIANGRLVVEETANIDGIYLVANEEGEFDGIKIAVVGEAQLPELARADVSLADGQSKLVVEVQTLQTSEGTDSNPEYVWISKSGSEVSAVVSSSDDASNYASHVVENPSQSAASAKEETTHSATPISDDSVARIGAVGYQTLFEAYNSSKDKDVIYLLKDIELSLDGVNIKDKNGFAVTKNLILDGTEFKHQIKTLAGLDRIFDVSDNTNDIVLTLKNLDLVGPTTTSYPSGYTRGVSFYGNSGKVEFNLINSSISASYYAINVAGSNTGTVAVNVIDSSFASGWCAAQSWSDSVTMNFKNSKLAGLNDKNYNADGWNNFATIVVNNGATNNVLNFENTEIYGGETTGNKQCFIGNREVDTEYTFNNCKFIYNGLEMTDAKDILSKFEYSKIVWKSCHIDNKELEVFGYITDVTLEVARETFEEYFGSDYEILSVESLVSKGKTYYYCFLLKK